MTELSPHWKAFYADFHEFVDKHAAAESPVQQVKPCPNCGAMCPLKWGRHTQKWRWHHPWENECKNRGSNNAEFYVDYPSAQAGEMFKKE